MEAIIAGEVLHWDLSIKCKKTLNVTKFTSLCAAALKMALTGGFRVYRKRGGSRPARRPSQPRAFKARFATGLERSPAVNWLAVTDPGRGMLNVDIAVIGAGLAYLPPLLASMPGSMVSHSSQHSDLTGFKGRKVAVLGASASALVYPYKSNS
jgi:hypothetical protein